VVVEKEFGGLPATGEGIWWHHRDEIWAIKGTHKIWNIAYFVATASESRTTNKFEACLFRICIRWIWFCNPHLQLFLIGQTERRRRHAKLVLSLKLFYYRKYPSVHGCRFKLSQTVCQYIITLYFVILPLFLRVLQIYKNILVRYLGHL
jgi:hypothetical protein